MVHRFASLLPSTDIDSKESPKIVGAMRISRCSGRAKETSGDSETVRKTHLRADVIQGIRGVYAESNQNDMGLRVGKWTQSLGGTQFQDERVSNKQEISPHCVDFIAKDLLKIQAFSASPVGRTCHFSNLKTGQESALGYSPHILPVLLCPIAPIGPASRPVLSQLRSSRRL